MGFYFMREMLVIYSVRIAYFCHIQWLDVMAARLHIFHPEAQSHTGSLREGRTCRWRDREKLIRKEVDDSKSQASPASWTRAYPLCQGERELACHRPSSGPGPKKYLF